MERPNVQEIIARCRRLGLEAPTDDTTYYLGRMRLMPTGPAPMVRWRKRLFGVMARHASSVPDFFSIPPTAWWSWEHASSSDRATQVAPYALIVPCSATPVCIAEKVTRVAITATGRWPSGGAFTPARPSAPDCLPASPRLRVAHCRAPRG